MKIALAVFAAMAALCSFPATSSAGEAAMPDGFVYLRQVDATIAQDMRYAAPDNFTGRPVPGYEAAECILAAPAARALSRVQADLKPMGLGLKVFDCYRPQRAVRAFVEWTGAPEDAASRRAYHPDVAKAALMSGYIASRSGHSRGAAVDLTLVALEDEPAKLPSPHTCEYAGASADATNEIDMGTPFDCFDPLSATRARGIGKTRKASRQTLVTAMKRHGFRNYSAEWWHFSFSPEPYPKRYFDFPIRPLPAKPAE
jgi:D-alanyl-D-alanine dipeptidase